MTQPIAIPSTATHHLSCFFMGNVRRVQSSLDVPASVACPAVRDPRGTGRSCNDGSGTGATVTPSAFNRRMGCARRPRMPTGRQALGFMERTGRDRTTSGQWPWPRRVGLRLRILRRCGDGSTNSPQGPGASCAVGRATHSPTEKVARPSPSCPMAACLLPSLHGASEPSRPKEQRVCSLGNRVWACWRPHSLTRRRSQRPRNQHGDPHRGREATRRVVSV